jgi:apolipoprotein D and lipocalin family protein
MKKLLIICLTTLLFLTSCVTKPAGINPVQGFQADKYLGKWYEIARLDNRFEKGMTHVNAEYSLNSDGSIKVLNSGVNADSTTRSYAEGVAKFVENSNTGFLKVSFFGPFYGAYVVFKVDDYYKYAYVAGGKGKDYLWLLSRTKTVPNEIKDDFIARTNNLGFDTDKLVWVKQ